MKVLLINGSPHEDGCTFTALSEVAAALEKEGIATRILQLGHDAVHGCAACYQCADTRECVVQDDLLPELVAAMSAADGIIVGSPVHYAGPNGALCALLDRAFFSAGERFRHKPAAAVVSCRRGGASTAFDRLNKYFTINQMPVVSSQYWNSVHGTCADDVRTDEEGMQTMRVLGRNMAWLLKNLASGAAPPPAQEE